MLFNSLSFLIFFPPVVIVFFIIPRKLKSLWLLAASYYFYMSWNVRHGVLIAFSTVLTWISGLILGKLSDLGKYRARKAVVAVSAVINLGILFYYKYFDFVLQHILEKPFETVLPVGISFYTFQALGYTVDVYRNEIEPEKNIITYALFVSFFPQLVAGPIERSKNLLNQLRKIREMNARKLFNCERIASGLVMMLWGYFQKMVIADRLAVLVDTVYNSWYFYGSVELFIATAAFSIQIYCDFASYSVIAAGAAKVMGFELMENFNTPYFSRSMREFWRRWHISLSGWFKDYLYIPLGGNRCGRLRQHFNTMAVFLASGLWHGAAWHYVVWGAVHGILQIVEAETEGIRTKISRIAGGKRDSFSFVFGRTVMTYIMTLFTLVFFRAESLTQAFGCLKKIFLKIDPWVLTDGTLCSLGLGAAELNVMMLALGVLLLVSLVRYRKGETLDVFLAGQGTWFRWMVIAGLFAGIFLFGVYGPGYDESQFIYFQF